ncbi:response regulator [bacterium]|nr:response regulator [bacterium]
MAQKTILLVEDDPNDEQLAVRALASDPARPGVRVARDGREALEILFRQTETESGAVRLGPLHLVLLDIRLPGMDGLEVLRRIRSHEKTRHLPVVMFTSSESGNDWTESYRLGANSVVRKPSDASQFEANLRQLAGYWLTVNMPSPIGVREAS